MTNHHALTDKKIAIMATDGVEEAEIKQPIQALQEAGAITSLIAPHKGQIQAMQHMETGDKIEVDLTLDQANTLDYDGLLLPGGALNADALRMESRAQLFVQEFDARKMPMAIICHAPWLLISAQIVRARRLTSYYTIQDDIRNAGGQWVDQAMAPEGNWVTSRSPQDLPQFIPAMITLFQQGKSPSAED